MSATIRPSHRARALLVLVASISTGCYATGHSRLDRGDALDRATGVTTLSGKEIPFATTGATIRNDTLFADGHRGQVMLPVDSIALVSSRHFSTERTIALGGGLTAVAILASFILGATSWNIP